jgi:hypothetical protein
MLERDAREGKSRVDAAAAEAERELCDAEHCPLLGLDFLPTSISISFGFGGSFFHCGS